MKQGWRKDLAEKLAAETGHFIDEYERSLRLLINVFEDRKPEELLGKINDWYSYTELSIETYKYALEHGYIHLVKYLPPKVDDEDEE